VGSLPPLAQHGRELRGLLLRRLTPQQAHEAGTHELLLPELTQLAGGGVARVDHQLADHGAEGRRVGEGLHGVLEAPLLVVGRHAAEDVAIERARELAMGERPRLAVGPPRVVGAREPFADDVEEGARVGAQTRRRFAARGQRLAQEAPVVPVEQMPRGARVARRRSHEVRLALHLDAEEAHGVAVVGLLAGGEVAGVPAVLHAQAHHLLEQHRHERVVAGVAQREPGREHDLGRGVAHGQLPAGETARHVREQRRGGTEAVEQEEVVELFLQQRGHRLGRPQEARNHHLHLGPRVEPQLALARRSLDRVEADLPHQATRSRRHGRDRHARARSRQAASGNRTAVPRRDVPWPPAAGAAAFG
jgi:hypothetical protein